MFAMWERFRYHAAMNQNNPLKIQETVNHLLDNGERAVLAEAAHKSGIDAAAAYLRENLPYLFVYKGGSHVAVHFASGDPERLALIVQNR